MKVSFSHLFKRLAGALPRGFFTALVVLIAGIGRTHPAAAQFTGGTMGDLFCNLDQNMGPFANFFDAVAYCAGAAFVGQGIHMLVKYYDNPPSVPIHQPLTRMGGGSILLALPYVSQTVINTMFTTYSGGGLAVCTPGAVTVVGPGVDLSVLITNLVGNISNPLTHAVSALTIAIGVFMMVRGLIKASKYGIDPNEYSMTKILTNLIVGAILMVVGQSFNVLMNTVFGTGTVTGGTDVSNWIFIQQLGASTEFVTVIQSCGYFIELIGMIAFLRGWLILKRASEGTGQATMAQGFTHLFGGVLAMNIFGFLEIMDSTFGTNFLL